MNIYIYDTRLLFSRREIQIIFFAEAMRNLMTSIVFKWNLQLQLASKHRSSNLYLFILINYRSEIRIINGHLGTVIHLVTDVHII